MSELKLIAGTSFSRGLSQAATHSLNDEECQTAENYVFKDRTPVVRKGTAVHASLPYPVAALKKFYKNDGGNYFLAWAGGNFYYSTTSGEFTNLSMASVSGDIDTAAVGNTVYFCDNSGPLKYFNGDEVGNAGISAPIYLRTLANCENINDWTKNAYGDLATDNNYLHVQRGTKSIAFYASSPTSSAIFTYGGGGASEVDTLIYNGEINYLYDSHHKLLRDSSGTLYNLFYTKKSGYADVNIYKSTTSGASWSKLVSVSNAGYPNAGYLAACINASSYIYFAYSYTSSNNGNPIRIAVRSCYSSIIGQPTYIASGPSQFLDLAVDASNELHLVYDTSSNYNLNYLVTSGGVWANSPTTLISNAIYNPINPPSIAVDMSNIVHVVAQVPTSGYLQIAHIYKDQNGWSNVSAITNTSGATLPSLGADHSGNLHCVWSNYGLTANQQTIYYRKRTGQTWGTGVNLSCVYLNNNQFGATINSDQSGNLHVLWYGRSPASPSYNQVRYVTFTSNWVLPVDLTTGTDHVSHVSLLNTLYPVIASGRVCYPKYKYATAYYKSLNYDTRYYAPARLGWTSSPDPTMTFDLTKFTANLSSTTNDNINLYVVPHIRSTISSFMLKLTDYSGNTARKELHTMSSWVATSNDEFALQVEIPKVTMSTDTGFAWGSCNLSLELTPVSSNPQKVAQVSVDNIFMTNCPPIPATTVSTAAITTTVVHDIYYWLTNAQNTINPLSRVTKTGNPATWVYWAYAFQGMQNELRSLEQEKLSKTPIPDGTYYYKTTFLQRGPDGNEIESNPSYQSSGIVIANPANAYYYVQLTDIPIPPDGCGIVGRRIYRRRHDEENYRAVHTIYDNTVNRFLDIYSDKTLGFGLVVDDRWPPPQAQYILKGSDQVVYYFNIKEDDDTFPSRVRWSKPYQPFYVPIENVTDVTPNDGTEGRGMFDFLGQLHLLKDRSTWTLIDGNLINRHSSIGCVAPKSIANGRNEVFWLSEQGVIKYTMRFENISHSIGGGSTYRIQKILDNIPKDRVKEAVGTYFDGYYFLAVCSENGTNNDTVLCYDVDNDVWSVFPNIQVNCWETWNGSQEGYRLFYGNNSGLICEFLTGDYDISTNISSRIRTKEFGLSVPEQAPRKAYLFLENLASGTVKSVTVNPYFDWVNNSDHNNTQTTSASFDTLKFDMPQTDAANFYSFEVVSTGRHRLNRLDIYGTTKNLR